MKQVKLFTLPAAGRKITMPVNDELGRRMKEFYEQVPKTKLMRRTPVAIRIDGKAFHTFTKGFQKPFDPILMKSMQETMKYLCENIQGCVLGYTQSDEITLILVDYQTLDTSAWFDYEVQKMCSIAASMATFAFNRFFERNVMQECQIDLLQEYGIETYPAQLCDTYCKAIERGAMFDARVFNIPKEEVTNLLYWRQLDAARNSVQMVGQANFSHNELQNKTCSMIQDMLMLQKGINWNDLPTDQKRGSCCVRGLEVRNGDTLRWGWIIDKNIPQFKGEGREYVESKITFN
jgi:tRNA(His) 5'-end guanylyltransferase